MCFFREEVLEVCSAVVADVCVGVQTVSAGGMLHTYRSLSTTTTLGLALRHVTTLAA